VDQNTKYNLLNILYIGDGQIPLLAQRFLLLVSINCRVMLCPLNKRIRTKFNKSTVVYIPRYRKNSRVIYVFGVSGIECKIVYNNLEMK